MADILMRFPEGRAKTLTLSYDDGTEQDVRLMNIMTEHGLKGTFNLNSGQYAEEGAVFPENTLFRPLSRKAALKLYKHSGMEIAVHGVHHPFLEQLPRNLCTYEVLQDRIQLERDYDVIVRGMAYPWGTYSDDVVETLRCCGIAYSRTVEHTEKFDLPADWLRLPSTCRHTNPRLMELAKRFVEGKVAYAPWMFYLWGHSYEFERDDNWSVIEEFAAYMGGRDEIWYATNIQIYDYFTAYQRLVFSMDRKKIYNPTAQLLFFELDKVIYRIRPGETICI